MPLTPPRVRETTSTTGTGTYSLAGAAAGFRTFVAGVGSGNQCWYCCQDDDDFEMGYGTVTAGSPDTLTRDFIEASSNGGAAQNWGAGTRNIFVTFPSTGLMFGTANLSELTDAPLALQTLGLLPTGQSGGTNGKVVRLSGANTWVDASQADTIAQLGPGMVAFRSGSRYYPSGSIITGLSGLTPGAVYYLSTSGNLTATAPTPSASVRRLPVGAAIASGTLHFAPGIPIGG